jgi:hypothetical protein
LRQTDKRLNLLPRLAKSFLDGRNPDLVQHSVLEMRSQRIYGLALGYEDLNEHEQLRKDPVVAVLAGRADLDEPLAGKSTLNRLELGTATKQDGPSTAITTAIAPCRSTSSAENRYGMRGCAKPITTQLPAAWRKLPESWRRFGGLGREFESSCAEIPGSAVTV